jgi:serine/threonine protein kinase
MVTVPWGSTIGQATAQLRKLDSFDYLVTSDNSFIIDAILSDPSHEISGLQADIHLKAKSYKTDHKYEILHMLGIGGFSKVFLGRSHKGELVALKMIEKDFIIKNGKKDIIMGERDILKNTDHPFITKVHEAY